MSSVRNERLEMCCPFQKQVSDVLYHRLLFLTLRQALCQYLIDIEHLVHVPEHLTNKVVSAIRWDHLLGSEGFDPGLPDQLSFSRLTNPVRQMALTHIPQVFEIAHKVALSVDDFIDGFLSLLLIIVTCVKYLLRYGFTPQGARFLYC